MKKLLIFLGLCLCLTGGCSFQKAHKTASPIPDFSGAENNSSHSDMENFSAARSCLADTSFSMIFPESIRIGFAGDMNFAEDWCTMEYYNNQEHGIADCISENIIEETNSLDLFMPNNEFAYSSRGTPMAGKAYTFCADPKRADILKQLGTDIVLLANNHVFDYGTDAFYDTLDTLENSGIAYVGAGRDLPEASAPCYFHFGNTTIAFVAATRAEKYILTPEAGTDTPGVLRCYDPSAFLDVIAEAEKHADYVIANVHFGTEYSNYAETYQRQMARSMIDSGADAVIGSHAHVLQGIEFYQGCPIIYSLGNFWFNEKTLYSCIFELELNPANAALTGVKFIPCIQQDYTTRWPEDFETQRKIWDFEEEISFGITIDDHGYVQETKQE